MMGVTALRAIALVGSFAATSSPASARARELVYSAPAGCPSRAEVAARIEARAPNGRDARIEVTAHGSGFHGDVVLGDGERRLARSVDAETCAAVVEALALVIALDREDDPPVVDPTAATPATPLEPLNADAKPPPPQPPRSDTPPTRVVAGLDVAGTSFARGTAIFAVPLYAELDFVAPWVHAIRGTLIYSFPTTTSNAIVRPEFRVIAAAFDYCPIAAIAGPRGNGTPAFLITACAHGELGVLDAAGADDPKSVHRRVWTNAGAIVRSRAGLTGNTPRPFLEVSGGLLVPLVRDHFHFAANDTITAPPLLWTLALGVGLVVR
jgi:hypothetical protein